MWAYHQMLSSQTGTGEVGGAGGVCVGLHIQFRVKLVSCAHKSECLSQLKIRYANHDRGAVMFLLISCFALVASALGE